MNHIVYMKCSKYASRNIYSYGFVINVDLKGGNMRVVVDKAQSRGYANHGWLKTHHTFSFANYYNPERVHFGMLRVLNDDSVAPGEGFDMHPHKKSRFFSSAERLS